VNDRAVAPSCAGLVATEDAIYDTSQVTSGPVFRRAPVWVYPGALKARRIEGRVVFTFVVNTDGHPDCSSIAVESATDSGFVGSARASLLGALFWPGCRDGRPVRVRVRQAYAFTIADGRQ
jgi:TonB family protein